MLVQRRRNSYELKKLVLLNILFFLITFNYGVLRAMKNVYVLGKGDTDLISWAKILGVIPAMLLFKYVYDTLNKRVSKNALVYYILAYFTFYYFCFLIYSTFFRVPLTVAEAEALAKEHAFWQFFKIWPLILFYVNSETLGTAMISVVLWGFANRITSNKEAKRCYTSLGIGAAFATIFAGILNAVIQLSDTALLCFVLGNHILFFIVYFYFSRQLDQNPKAYNVPVEKKQKKKKKQLGFIASIKALLHSKDASFLTWILCIVVCYAMAVNLFEVVHSQWAKKLGEKAGELSGDGNETKMFLKKIMGGQLIATGFVSLFIIFFLSGWVKKHGWRFTAMTVPVVFFTGTIIFFGSMIFIGDPTTIVAWKDSGGHWIVMGCGVFVLVCVKSAKYVFLDSTKENAYLVLNETSKIEGKSAVDGVGSRVGKAGGALINILLTTLVGGKSKALGLKWIFAFLVILMIVLWIYAVYNLANQYNVRSRAMEQSEQATKVAK